MDDYLSEQVVKSDEKVCCLTLIVPETLEHEIIDMMIQETEHLHAFFSDKEEGHNLGWKALNHAENVLGWKKCVHFKILLSPAKAYHMISYFQTHFHHVGITYWVHEVLSAGTI